MNAIIHTQNWNFYKSHYIMEYRGLAMLRITEEQDEFEISDLYVHPEYRRNGLGNQILCIAIDFCKAIRNHGKIVVCVNENSEKFVEEWYRRKGFVLERIQSQIQITDSKEQDWYKVFVMTF